MNRPHRSTCVCLWLLFVGALAQGGCAAKTERSFDPLEEARHRLVEAPGDASVHLELSELFLAQRDYLRARQYLSLAERGFSGGSAQNVDREQIFRVAILIAVRSQQYTEAIRRCTQRLEQGEDARVRGLLATLLETTGDEAGAARQLRLLALLHPDEPHRLLDLARFYERSAHPARMQLARELYQRYLSQAPKGAEAAQVRAALSIDQLEQTAARN